MKNNLIDLLRFIAFKLMVIHHFYNINSKYKFLSNEIEIIGLISRTLFILLSGISINYRKDKNKKKK
jgi:peptidoglycan/LPS O-acetylase OafA/YrhL